MERHDRDVIPIPRHLAVIMDGNGRWATLRGSPRWRGHEVGAERLNELIINSLDLRIPFLTVFAFSTENWSRSQTEVDAIFEIIREWLRRTTADFASRGVKLQWAGDPCDLPWPLLSQLSDSARATSSNSELVFTLCVNYGGRAEILRAAGRLLCEVVQGRIHPGVIDEALVAKFLDFPDVPDIDLLIRTSGEQRLSNFMLWQAVNARVLFPETLWPDFGRVDLEDCLTAWKKRESAPDV